MNESIHAVPEPVRTKALQLLDPDDMTFEEFAEFEEMVGAEQTQRVLKGDISAKALIALVFLTRRRSEPAVTLETVRAMRFGDVDFGAPGGGDPNPPGSAD